MASPRWYFWTKIPKFHHNFPNFQLEIWIFSNFSKKGPNFRKLRNLTYFELQLSQFSAKSEKLFFEKKSEFILQRIPMEFFFYMEILCKNLAKFQTWNLTFLNFFKKSLECSKKSQIYLLWTSSEPILSKIRAPFFSKKKASVVVWIWKKIPKISEISNLKSDFFLILQKKPPMFQTIRNLFVLNFIWANFQQN